LRRDADSGIGNRKSQSGALVILRLGIGINRDSSLVRKLDRISGEVEENPPEATEVAPDSGRKSRHNICRKKQLFVLGARTFGHIVNYAVQHYAGGGFNRAGANLDLLEFSGAQLVSTIEGHIVA